MNGIYLAAEKFTKGRRAGFVGESAAGSFYYKVNFSGVDPTPGLPIQAVPKRKRPRGRGRKKRQRGHQRRKKKRGNLKYGTESSEEKHHTRQKRGNQRRGKCNGLWKRTPKKMNHAKEKRGTITGKVETRRE